MKTDITKYFWTETVNTTCYVQNIVYIGPILNKTLCELFK